MRPKGVFAVLGVLASVAIVAGLMGPEFAKADREDSAAVVRAGDAVVEEANARVEGGPTVEVEARAGEEEGGSGGSGSAESDSGESGDSGDEATEQSEESTPPKAGEVVLRMRGDEGVEFSGTCSIGGEEKTLEGKVPEEFTFVLDSGELECEVRKEGGDGTLKMVLVSGDDRIVQRVNGESTMKLAYSGDGASSSSSSTRSSSSVSGSSNVVTQSSSSVVQSNSSSTGD